MGGDDLRTATLLRCVNAVVVVAPLNKPRLLLLQVLDEVKAGYQLELPKLGIVNVTVFNLVDDVSCAMDLSIHECHILQHPCV